ncbi:MULTISPECIES: DUF6074 family protein [unclassified Chelatococcus]|uniref:DUF6074 family protein n=1 Tax=unclassified Chelatococcus TaxID=2638111 RepID=UPI001BCDF3BD|nr:MULTISPECIES: DUF6074 family protein [unclassified Chelatococcus]CAH1672317.1 hypothetical protein CHELA20_50904 [Hyphomicrobiales bacterium]MBS7738963.1 hypothetical protein [Chelatococcus sp. HY11]MBX3543396.1 hypothetical protein [Chelatococcus sp.]MCO5076507.1 DUF6074 family protein [Chelatococcus sp.]CAH1675450.1 hypothetical protein CHELA41_24109 [Hyphomicrobiales bacterium]
MTANRRKPLLNAPTTSATLVIFPPARRLDFVTRHAEIVAGLSAAAGGKHVQVQLDIQVKAWRRKGITEERIDAARRELDGAIRAAVWKFVLLGRSG